MGSTIGIDIGGVIIDRTNDKTDTSFFGPNYLASSAVDGVFNAIRALTQAGWTVYLVSKCGENVETKTLEWLKHHDFYALTKVPAQNIRFCRQRRDKAPICEELGISYFVDDRLEVLSYLTSVSNLFLFHPEPKEKQRFERYLDKVTTVQTWAELLPLLLNDADAQLAG